MATKEQIVKAGKLFFCGSVPFCEPVLEKLGKKPHSKIPEMTEGEFQKLSRALQESDDYVQQFLEIYPSWKEERLSCIEEIRKIADNIDFHHRNITATQIPTAGVGIAGAVCTITGLALIPVTFGASLGLTITGAALGIGSAVAGATTVVTDIGIKIDRVKKVRALADNHRCATERICNIAQEIQQHLSEVQKMPAYKNACIEMGGSSTNVSGKLMINAISVSRAAFNTIPKASKSVHILRKGLGLAAAVRASTSSLLRTMEVVTDAGMSTTRVVATTTGKILTGVSFAFSAIGIVVDLLTAGAAIYKLAKGSKTSTSNQLREQAKNLEEEMNFMKRLHEQLTEDDN